MSHELMCRFFYWVSLTVSAERFVPTILDDDWFIEVVAPVEISKSFRGWPE
jgi:hypothetical protein